MTKGKTAKFEKKTDAKFEKKTGAKFEKKTDTKPFNFYGVRKTRNPKYYSVTLVRGSDKKREWINVPVNAKNVYIDEGYALLKLSLLEDNHNEDEDEDEDDDDEAVGEDMPF